MPVASKWLGALSRPSPWTPTPYESTGRGPGPRHDMAGTRTVPETAIVLLLVAAVVWTTWAARSARHDDWPGAGMVPPHRGIEAGVS